MIRKLTNAWKRRRFLLSEHHQLPDGWLSRSQAECLYRLGLEEPGPILEIGSWIGRSTCCIAAGIRDSGGRKTFVAVDLGLASKEEWLQFFGRPIDRKPNKELYLKHIEQPGGSIESLRINLISRGLDPYVEIHKGDFRTMKFAEKFQCIFCDATHNEREIRANIPQLNQLLLPGGLLVSDDIRTPEFLQILLELMPFSKHHLKDSFFSGRKEG